MVVIDCRFRKYAITETEQIKTMQNCCIVYSLALLVVFYKQYALIFVFPPASTFSLFKCRHFLLKRKAMLRLQRKNSMRN